LVDFDQDGDDEGMCFSMYECADDDELDFDSQVPIPADSDEGDSDADSSVDSDADSEDFDFEPSSVYDYLYGDYDDQDLEGAWEYALCMENDNCGEPFKD